MTQTPPEADARFALDALPGIRWRPVEREDLPVIAEFYVEVATHDENPDRTSLSGIEEVGYPFDCRVSGSLLACRLEVCTTQGRTGS